MVYRSQERRNDGKGYEKRIQRFMFVMGDFPNPSQTFILREMACLREKGVDFSVVAEKRVPNSDLGPTIKSIQDDAYYLPSKTRIAFCAATFFVRHPLWTATLIAWAMRLPHRTLFHRARFLGTLMSAMAMAPRLSKLGVERLHAHFAGFQTELAMCLSNLLDIPYGVSWHAYGIWKDRNILEEKLSGADTIITCTKYNADHLRQLAPQRANDIHMVNHGIDVDKLQPEELKPQKTPLVLAVGRLIPKKGLKYLLHAAALLKAEGVTFRMTIVGDGPEKESLIQIANTLNLERSVTFTGALPNQEVLKLINDAYMLVAPSVRDEHGNIDGIPNVLIEAMALERPVIGSDLSGIPEVVTEYTGLLVPPGSVSDMALAIKRMLTDRQLALKCGKAGRAVVERTFNIEINVTKQLEILKNLYSKQAVPLITAHERVCPRKNMIDDTERRKKGA